MSEQPFELYQTVPDEDSFDAGYVPVTDDAGPLEGHPETIPDEEVEGDNS